MPDSTAHSTPSEPAAPPATGSGLRLDALGFSRTRALMFGIACVWFGALAWLNRNVVMDDPWITFRYARNLLAGHGLAFNPGDALEGYSNFTWMLLSCVPLALGFEPLGAMRVLAMAAAVITLGMLAFGLPGSRRQDTGAFTGSAAAALVLGAGWPFALWTLGGLETALYAALLLAFVLAAARALAEGTAAWAWAAGGLLGALSLTRPEAPMFLALTVPMALASRDGRVQALRLAGAFAVVFVPYTLMRLGVFGTLMPNSVRAKLGGSPLDTAVAGGRYIGQWMIWGGLLPVALAAFGCWKGLRERPQRALCVMAASAIGMQALFILGVGGDWMPAFRFLVPVLPLVALLAGVALDRLWAVVAWPLLVAMLALAPVQAYFEREVRFARWIAEGSLLVQPLIRIGEDLRVLAKPDSVLAATEAGVIPYYSNLRLIDMLGLVDREIARLPGGLHEKHDAGIVLARRPRYILLGVTITANGEVGTWAPDQKVMADPDFRAHYREVRRWPRPMGAAAYGRQDGAMILFELAEVAEGS